MTRKQQILFVGQEWAEKQALLISLKIIQHKLQSMLRVMENFSNGEGSVSVWAAKIKTIEGTKYSPTGFGFVHKKVYPSGPGIFSDPTGTTAQEFLDFAQFASSAMASIWFTTTIHQHD